MQPPLLFSVSLLFLLVRVALEMEVTVSSFNTNQRSPLPLMGVISVSVISVIAAHGCGTEFYLKNPTPPGAAQAT